MSEKPTPPADAQAPVGLLESWLQLLALSSLAVAQPLLDTLGRFGEFLVAHQLEPVEIVLLTIAIVAALPFGLWLIVAVAGRLSSSLATWLHLGFVGLLAGLWALRALAVGAGQGSIVAFTGAVATGVLVVWLISRLPPVRTLLSWAAAASVVVALHFLLLSPASRLLRGFEAESSMGPKEGSAIGPPLVLIVFDELPTGSLLTPEGEVDAARFPHFAALAEDSVFFSQATTVTSGTAYAVPAILTGRYPQEQKFPIHLDYQENLFTLFGERYRIHAKETLTQLCPQSLCAQERPPLSERARSLASDLEIVFLHLVLPTDLSSRLPAITGRWRDFAAHWKPKERGGVVGVERSERLDIPGLLDRYVGEIDGDSSVLHYLHLELPHIPWRYLPSGMEYGPVSHSDFALGVDEDTAWRDDEWLLTLALQRHLLQTAYADRVLGKIIRALRDRGLYDEALLVVTADHGLAFQIGEPGRRLTEANVAEVAAVPLFVRGGGAGPHGSNQMPVEVVDILPTFADAIGVELPSPVDGRSLLDPGYAGRESKRIVVPDEGLRATVSAAQVAQSNIAAAGRIAAAFPEPGLDGLFRVGRHLELVDRPVEQLEQRAGSGLEVAVEQLWLFDAVDPATGFVPARVDGRLRSIGDQTGGAVAIALNGVVRAAVPSYSDRGVERFSALLPESAFEKGANRLEIFGVGQGAAGQLVLQTTVDRSGPGYSLARSEAGEVVGIEATNGTGCTLADEAVEGRVFREGLSFQGWALDSAGESQVVILMTFVDGGLVWAGPTGAEPLPGLETSAASERPGFATAGFLFGLTRPLLPRGDASELRVFGVVGDRCTELSIVGD